MLTPNDNIFKADVKHPLISPDGPSSGVASPPPYAPQPESSSSTAGPSSPTTGQISPRTNHLYIIETNTSVRGEWTIDPNFRIPPLFMPKVPEGEELQNVHLASENGSVSAKLSLVSDVPTKARLFVGSTNASVTVHIATRVNTKFHLTVKNENGSNNVYIPRNFQGPVTFTNTNGSTYFSEAVTPYIRHFGKHDGVGRAFIGDLNGYGEREDDVWEGDELVINNQNARNTIYFADEADPWKRGFFARLFGYTGN